MDGSVCSDLPPSSIANTLRTLLKALSTLCHKSKQISFYACRLYRECPNRILPFVIIYDTISFICLSFDLGDHLTFKFLKLEISSSLFCSSAVREFIVGPFNKSKEINRFSLSIFEYKLLDVSNIRHYNILQLCQQLSLGHSIHFSIREVHKFAGKTRRQNVDLDTSERNLNFSTLLLNQYLFFLGKFAMKNMSFFSFAKMRISLKLILESSSRRLCSANNRRIANGFYETLILFY